MKRNSFRRVTCSLRNAGSLQSILFVPHPSLQVCFPTRFPSNQNLQNTSNGIYTPSKGLLLAAAKHHSGKLKPTPTGGFPAGHLAFPVVIPLQIKGSRAASELSKNASLQTPIWKKNGENTREIRNIARSMIRSCGLRSHFGKSYTNSLLSYLLLKSYLNNSSKKSRIACHERRSAFSLYAAPLELSFPAIFCVKE